MNSEAWHQVIDAGALGWHRRLYKQVLKSRRRFYLIMMNGRGQLVRRALVRDYLAKKVGNTAAK